MSRVPDRAKYATLLRLLQADPMEAHLRASHGGDYTDGQVKHMVRWLRRRRLIRVSPELSDGVFGNVLTVTEDGCEFLAVMGANPSRDGREFVTGGDRPPPNPPSSSTGTTQNPQPQAPEPDRGPYCRGAHNIRFVLKVETEGSLLLRFRHRKRMHGWDSYYDTFGDGTYVQTNGPEGRRSLMVIFRQDGADPEQVMLDAFQRVLALKTLLEKDWQCKLGEPSARKGQKLEIGRHPVAESLTMQGISYQGPDFAVDASDGPAEMHVYTVEDAKAVLRSDRNRQTLAEAVPAMLRDIRDHQASLELHQEWIGELVKAVKVQTETQGRLLELVGAGKAAPPPKPPEPGPEPGGYS